MPEINPFKRLRSWTLQNAQEQGQLLVVTCNLCRVTHRYLPKDVAELLGNMTLDKVLCRFRCERCSNKNYMALNLHFPHGDVYGQLRIKRLKDIKTVRIPIWTEDTL